MFLSEFHFNEPFRPCPEIVSAVTVFKGGGGGSAGKVEFPAYMETAHSKWLDHAATDNPTNSVIDALNSAHSSDPYSSAAAYDPDTDITNMLAELATYDTNVGLLLSGTGLDTLMSAILSSTWIDDEVDAFADRLDDQLAADVYPRFEAGMRDINAVVSSAFTVGRAMIEDGRNREVSQFSAQMQGSTRLTAATQLIQLTIQEYRALSHMTTEMYRMKNSWKTFQVGKDYEYDEADAAWQLKTWQYAGNVMSAPAGGSAFVPDRAEGPSKGQAAASGAMAGASIGASTGSGYGVVIGAVIGGVAGYLAA